MAQFCAWLALQASEKRPWGRVSLNPWEGSFTGLALVGLEMKQKWLLENGLSQASHPCRSSVSWNTL